jgi:hypothetical protein
MSTTSRSRRSFSRTARPHLVELREDSVRVDHALKQVRAVLAQGAHNKVEGKGAEKGSQEQRHKNVEEHDVGVEGRVEGTDGPLVCLGVEVEELREALRGQEEHHRRGRENGVRVGSTHIAMAGKLRVQ